ncbi:hypothetical protein C8J56DRAFT_1167750 [Mycena floridula]|nr:hypothetical protein C8J56DRAFT_1167750 [Mycena floridula]
MEPPCYRRFSNELPAYSRRNTIPYAPAVVSRARSAPTEHIITLPGTKTTLKVYSSAKSPSSLPTIYEKETLRGEVVLESDKGVQGIRVSVTGRIISGSECADSHTFLSRTMSLAPGVRTFEIELPRTLEGEKMPETFQERNSGVSVQYHLTVLVDKGKFRGNTHIVTAFAYVPTNKPPPASLLRQLASQQSLPIPGPNVDPDGWGHFEGLSLAKPFVYTRGTSIPCFSSSPAILRRTVRYSFKSVLGKKDITWREETEEVARAGSDCIPLPKTLKPTSSMAHFSVSYHIVVGRLAIPVDIVTMHARGPREECPPAYNSSTSTTTTEREWINPDRMAFTTPMIR